MDLISVFSPEIWVLLAISLMLLYWVFGNMMQNAIKSMEKYGGNWTGEFDTTMEQLRVAIVTVNSTGVDAGLATGLSTWIAAAMNHLKEWHPFLNTVMGQLFSDTSENDDKTEAAIDEKHKSMHQFIWLEAIKAGVLASIPLVGIFRDNDVEKLKKNLKRYRDLFGVDDESLEFMAKDFQVPVENLKKIIKSPYLLQTKKDETLAEKLLKYLEIFASANGGLLATGLYFRKIFYLQFHFLDTVTEDAKVLLRESFRRGSNKKHVYIYNTGPSFLLQRAIKSSKKP